MADRKTTPRSGALKIADKAKLEVPEEIIASVGTITPDNAAPDAEKPADTEAPDAEQIADVAQKDSPDQEETVPPTVPAAVLADEKGIDKPVAVPATPTAAQLAASATQAKVATLWTEYLVAIPGNSGEFAEPTDDQIDAMIDAYMEANPGTRASKAAFAVKDQVDADRAAHAAAAASGNSVKLEYYRAMKAELGAMAAAVDVLIAAAGGKVASAPRKASKADAVVTDGKAASTTWAEKAAKMYAWADAHALTDIVFMDQTVGGYEGSMHCVKLHRDGKLEKVTVDGEYAITPTGEFVTTPIYFTAKDGSRPKYSPDQMFGILLGKQVIDGISYTGVKAHLGSYKAILEDCK